MSGASVLVAVSTGCFHGVGVVTEDAVDRVRDLGAGGVEIYVQGPPELESDVVDAIVARTRASHLAVVSVHPYVYGWENLLFTHYQRQRGWALQHVTDHLVLCSATGAAAYVSHGPPPHHVLDEQRRLSRHYIAVTRDLVAMAAECGVQYCLESVSYGLAASPDDLRRHRDAIPDLRFVIDVKSAWKSGYRPVDFLAPDLLPVIHHTQVSFRSGKRYGLPARNEGDALADPDVTAVVAIEIPHVIEVEATTLDDINLSLAAVLRARDAAHPAPGH